jgi:hypothetical protein
MPQNPIENNSIGLFRRLPEKAVGLAVEYLKLGSGNSLGQGFSLNEMITAGTIVVADQN